MERLMEDAVNVQNLLPWIESDEDIINFMRKIPLDKSHLRNQLTIRYFLKERDSSGDGFEKDIEDDAREIVVVMPGTSYKEIKDRLTVLGNMPNRKEVVLRQLLYKKPDLERIVNEIDPNFNNKRKSQSESDPPNGSYDLSPNNNETNIKIKIRKIEGSLEVVSSIKEKTGQLKQIIEDWRPLEGREQGMLPQKTREEIGNQALYSPQVGHLRIKGFDTRVKKKPSKLKDHFQVFRETLALTQPRSASSSSSASVTSSIHSETSTPDSTVSTPAAQGDNLIDIDFMNEDMKNTQPSASGTVMPIGSWEEEWRPRTSTPYKYNNYDYEIVSFPDNKEGNSIHKKMQPIEETSENTMNSCDTDLGGEPNFNLIDYIYEVYQLPRHKIFKLCTDHKLNLSERPDLGKLNIILNEFYDKEMVNSENSDVLSSSDSETQEYQLDEVLPVGVYKPDSNPENKAITVKDPSGKEFKLKEPVLNIGKSAITCASSLSKPVVPKWNSQSFVVSNPDMLNRNVFLPNPNMPNPLIKRARFKFPNQPIHGEGNIMPSLQRPVLDGQVATAAAAAEKAMHHCAIHGERNIIPALPKPYLDRQVKKAAEAQETLVKDLPVDLTGPEESKLNLFVNSARSEAGPSSAQNQKTRDVDDGIVFRLMEIFPDACPEYIRNMCDGKTWPQFNDIVTQLLSAENYPKRPQRVASPVKEVDPEQQFEILKELLPDADPDFLRMQCDKYANNDKGLKEFINLAMESKDYPTMKEYLRRQQLSTQQRQYTTEFSIEKFIELFPDPEKTFNDPNRVVQIDQMSSHYIVIFFRNKYTKISARIIQQVLVANNFRVIPSNKRFLELVESNRNIMKSRRKAAPLPDNLQSIPLLQELAYIDHKAEIDRYMVDKHIQEEIERLETKNQGLMQTCQCCYDEEVMPKDTFPCPNGCKFCKDCIQKSCEVAFGEGKLVFPCLADCSSEFTLQTLQNVLPPKMFSKVAQKKALEEIKAAGIEDLEMCPFCDFASIPNEADKIFRCLNPDCMKESCRLCKEPNHIPLKCEEVEKDEDVKARIHIEDAMTKALIRTCWKCGTSFFKEEGCNKMTCSCGAQMCYICKKPVKDYTHFNGIGGDKFHRCPLYSDTNTVNQENVMKAAEAAKAEIDPSNLKVDPAADVETHYSDRRKKLPREPHLELVNNVRQQVMLLQQHHRHRPRHHHHHHHQYGFVGFHVPYDPQQHVEEDL